MSRISLRSLALVSAGLPLGVLLVALTFPGGPRGLWDGYRTTGEALAPTDADRFVLEWQGKELSEDHVRNAAKGKSFRVALRRGDDDDRVSRAKVDLDKDGLWDEIWSLSGPQTFKVVSPLDDEVYAATWLWDGTDWRRQAMGSVRPGAASDAGLGGRDPERGRSAGNWEVLSTEETEPSMNP